MDLDIIRMIIILTIGVLFIFVCFTVLSYYLISKSLIFLQLTDRRLRFSVKLSSFISGILFTGLIFLLAAGTVFFFKLNSAILRFLYVFCLVIVPFIFVKFIISNKNKCYKCTSIVNEYERTRTSRVLFLIGLVLMIINIFIFPTNSFWYIIFVMILTFMISIQNLLNPIALTKKYLIIPMHVLGNVKMSFENISELEIKKGLLGNNYLEISYNNKKSNDVDTRNKIKVKIYNLGNMDIFIKDIYKETNNNNSIKFE